MDLGCDRYGKICEKIEKKKYNIHTTEGEIYTYRRAIISVVFHRVKEPSSTTWLNNYDYRHSFNLFWTKLFLWKIPSNQCVHSPIYAIHTYMYNYNVYYTCICIHQQNLKVFNLFSIFEIFCFLVFVYM